MSDRTDEDAMEKAEKAEGWKLLVDVHGYIGMHIFNICAIMLAEYAQDSYVTDD